MAVNRFSKVVAPSRFSPLSFEEQSFAPILLRQREDQIMNDKDLLLQEMANLEVPEIYQNTLDNERTALENDLSSLAEKIQKEGAGNLNYLNEFRNLRNKYNKSVSKSGNIGRAVGVKTQMDAMKDAYFKDAYNKKQPAEHIARNWEIEKNKYLQGLPSDLNKFKGTLPEFTPDFAPDSISLSDSVKELAGFMTGMSEEMKESFYFDIARDGTLMAIDKKTGKATNEKQINALKDQIQNTLLNPDSPVNRNLKWRNIDPQSLINDIDNYATMMTKISTTESERISRTFTNPNTKTKTTKDGNTVEIGGGSLQFYQTGLPEVINSQNANSIKREIKNIQNDKSLTDYERNKKLMEYNNYYLYKKKFERSDEFITAINEEISGNDYWKEKGITNYEDYKKWEESETITDTILREAIPRIKNNPIASFSEGLSEEELLSLSPEELNSKLSPEEKKEIIDAAFTTAAEFMNPNLKAYRELEKQKNKLTENYSELSNTLLKPMRMWTYDITKDAGDIQKIINDGFARQPMDAIAKAGLLRIANEDGVFDTEAANETTTNENEKYAAFNSRLLNSDNTKFNLIGFSDGGINDNAIFQFRVTTGTGDDKRVDKIAIELDPVKLDGLTRQFLNKNGAFYSGLDKNGQNVMDFIRDKAEYGGVATDVSSIATEKELYNPTDSKNIVSYSKKRTASAPGNLRVRSEEDYANKYLFYSNDDTNQFSIQVGDNGSYSAYKKDDNGNITSFNFIDYAKREAIIQANKSDVIGAIQTNKELEQYIMDFGKANTLYNIVDNISDFDNIEKEAIIYNNDPEFKKVLIEYENKFKYLTEEERKNPDNLRAVSKLFDRIANLRINSKLIKEIL